MEDTNDKLLEKLLDGTITQAEMNRLTAFLDTEQGQAAISRQMDAVLSQAESSDRTAAMDKRLAAVYRDISRHIRKTRIRHYVLRAAAVIVPLFIVASLLYLEQRQTQLFSSPEYAEIITAAGERTQVVFQDGTRAYLNACSRLRYPVKFGFWSREVHLDGEAYFNVQSNKSRPFIVDINGASVRVTGTSFNVSAYSDCPTSTVTLDEGHVELVTAHDTYSLQPSEQICYDRTAGRITVSKLTTTKWQRLWKDNIIAFDKAPLKEVIRTLRRWYGADFVVKDEEAYEYAYTFTSDFVPLESLLRDLELLSPVRFRNNDGRIEIFIK